MVSMCVCECLPINVYLSNTEVREPKAHKYPFLKSPSKALLKLLKDWELTTFSGKLFQPSITLVSKKPLLTDLFDDF